MAFIRVQGDPTKSGLRIWVLAVSSSARVVGKWQLVMRWLDLSWNHQILYIDGCLFVSQSKMTHFAMTTI